MHAYESITFKDVTDAFKATGVYSFQKGFANRFKTTEDKQRQLAEIKRNNIAQGVPLSKVKLFRKNTTDMKILQKFTNVIKSGMGPSRTYQ